MRILELLLAPMAGGAETLVAGLEKEFRSIGHDVDIAFLDSAPSRDQQQLADALFTSNQLAIAQHSAAPPLQRHRRIARVTGTRTLIRSGGFDVVHTHTFLPNTYGRIGAILAMSGARVVVTHHHASGIAAQYPERRHRALERILLRNTAAVTTVTEADREAFLKMFPVAPDRVHFIPNGLPRETLRKEGASARPSRFIAVSRLAPTKDIRTLVEGFHQYASTTSAEPVLQVVGPWISDQYHDELQDVLRSLGHPSSIQFLGMRTDVPQLLTTADAYISCSPIEAHPISVIEAVATGLPTVLSSIPAHLMIDTLCNPAASTFFPAGSSRGLATALHTLESNWAGLSSNALLRSQTAARTFSLERCAAAYLEVFERTSTSANTRRKIETGSELVNLP